MSDSRKLWIDRQGKPVITTTLNGLKNATRWGWAPAVAVDATHDERVRAEAWDEGWEARHNYDERAGEPPPPNPYEKGSDDDH